jgi:hypothetical protein
LLVLIWKLFKFVVHGYFGLVEAIKQMWGFSVFVSIALSGLP